MDDEVEAESVGEGVLPEERQDNSCSSINESSAGVEEQVDNDDEEPMLAVEVGKNLIISTLLLIKNCYRNFGH